MDNGLIQDRQPSRMGFVSTRANRQLIASKGIDHADCISTSHEQIKLE